VLGADVVVVEADRLLLGEHQHLLRPGREILHAKGAIARMFLGHRRSSNAKPLPMSQSA